jgi:hypothetical protein
MNEQVMLSGHVEQSLVRARQSAGQWLLAVQDTTFMSYLGHHAMQGLSPLQGQSLGLAQHNMLLLNESGLPLGILDQQYWTRQGGARDLPAGQKESWKWEQGLAVVNRHLGDLGKRVMLVQDREADIFTFFKAQRNASVEILVRVYLPRNLEIVSAGQDAGQDAGHRHHLDEIGQHLPVQAQRKVRIQRKGKEVELTLDLQWSKVNVLPRTSPGARKRAALGLSLVIARETACINPATGESLFHPEEAAEWYLLTSLSVDNAEEALLVVGFYALRWRIERFHYTLKSGALKVEKLQFDDINTLINALTFYSVVAWKILALHYTLRQEPEAPAQTIYTPEEVTLLSQIKRKPVTTVAEATVAMATIVGFVPTRKQPLPGIKILTEAIERFEFVKIGAQAVLHSTGKPLLD